MKLLPPVIVALLFISTTLLNCGNAANILLGYAPDAKSHYRTILPFAERLASVGHNVTIFHVTSQPDSVRSIHPNIKTIVAYLEEHKREEKVAKVGSMMWSSTLHGAMVPLIYWMMRVVVESLVTEEPIKIQEALNGEWDLIITSSLFNVHTVAFTATLNRYSDVPYIIFHPTTTTSFCSQAIAAGQNWAIAPNLFGTEPAGFNITYDARSIVDRGLNFGEYITEYAATMINEMFLLPMMMKVYDASFYDYLKFLNGAAFHLSDGLELIGFPNSHVPDVRSVTSNCADAKPLPTEYADFVEDPDSKGTIYVAFGTFVPWDNAPLHKKHAMFDALARFTDYRIIFSYNGKFPPDVPSHIRLVKWAPQFDVLAHPKTKVFLTHGGLKSVKESLCSRTPMVVMPMFAEQNRNAKIVIRAGMGVAINKYSLNANEAESVIRHLLDTPEYARRASKLRDIFLDRPVHDLDAAMHYVARVARHGNAIRRRRAGETVEWTPIAFFFRRTAIHLDLIQFYNAELLLLVLSIILLLGVK